MSLKGHRDVRERFTKISRPRQRIVVTTLGTSGDLHPFLAIALKLQAHGHDVVVATARAYRQKIERLGLGFAAVRPDWLTVFRSALPVLQATPARPDYLERSQLLEALWPDEEEREVAGR